jgi:hypothetical protein
MDVAAVSVELKNVQLAQKVDVALAKKVMDMSKENAQALAGMMERSVNPNLGGNIDVKV